MVICIENAKVNSGKEREHLRGAVSGGAAVRGARRAPS